MSQYLPKPFRCSGGNINFKVDLLSYATKTDLKNVTYVDTSSFALKANLTSLKTEVDKLDIGKLTTVDIDLSKLLLKTMLLKKLFMKKTRKKISDLTDFIKKTIKRQDFGC